MERLRALFAHQDQIDEDTLIRMIMEDNTPDNEPEEEQEDELVYTPSTYNWFPDEEREEHADPREEELMTKIFTPIEFRHGRFVLRNYCTNQQIREELEKSKREESSRPPDGEAPSEQPMEWVADNMYGSVVGRRGPVGPNPVDIDPTLLERDRKRKKPTVWTDEDRAIYGDNELADSPPALAPASPAAPVPENLTRSMSTMTLNDVPPPAAAGQQGGPSTSGRTVNESTLLDFYQEDFRLIPGDVIIFKTARLVKRWTDHHPSRMQNMVAIYDDPNYFEDHGQYRLNFLDTYPMEKGDIVVRFGNFTNFWTWIRHSTLNFYMYWPGLIPPVGSNKEALHPWYWIDQGCQQLGIGGTDIGQTLPISIPVAPKNMPISTIVPDFRLRQGDVLIHHGMVDSKAPPFDHRLETYVWNPFLEGIGADRLVSPLDRVLRHGMNFQFWRNPRVRAGLQSSTAHVELYYLDQNRDWRFLGLCTAEFSDHITRRRAVIPLVEVPLTGDIIFDRVVEGRKTQFWNQELNMGGMVSFHRYEFFKDYGMEERPFVWYKDAGKYGLGNITTVFRFGSFSFDKDPEIWEWVQGNNVEMFILNTRGSSWRLNSVERWPPNLQRPLPNYSWKPYNRDDIEEVPPNFAPQKGDIILRLKKDDRAVERNQNPLLVGSMYNPHFDVKAKMSIFGPQINRCQGSDFLIRAGYEKNRINPTWTNATVEVYCYEYTSTKGVRRNPKWRFKGRDMHIFGTNFTSGGLKGVHRSGFGDLSVSDIPMINSSNDRPTFGHVR